MRSKRLVVGRLPFGRLRIGLLVSGLTALLVFAGMGPASAVGPLTATGDGMTVTVVSVQLVNKVAVDVNFSVTCTTANFGGSTPGDTYFVIAGFTLSESVKGTIVTNQVSNGLSGNWPHPTCDGTPQAFTIQLVPAGGTGYRPGPAYASNGQVGVFDTDARCGYLPGFNPPFPTPCDTVSFSGGVQISGGAY